MANCPVGSPADEWDRRPIPRRTVRHQRTPRQIRGRQIPRDQRARRPRRTTGVTSERHDPWPTMEAAHPLSRIVAPDDPPGDSGDDRHPYLSGVRPGEALELQVGCCPDPIDDGTGSIRYQLHGLFFKGARNPDGTPARGGVSRKVPWTVVPPVADAVRVLERIVDGPMLFPTNPPWITGSPGRTAHRRRDDYIGRQRPHRIVHRLGQQLHRQPRPRRRTHPPRPRRRRRRHALPQDHRLAHRPTSRRPHRPGTAIRASANIRRR